MSSKLKIEEIKNIARNIVNILLTEGDSIRPLQGSPLPTQLPTGTPSGTPPKVGLAATDQDKTAPKDHSPSTRTTSGKAARSTISKNTNVKLHVAPSGNPLGIYANESVEGKKGTAETDGLKDSIDDDKEELEFPVDLQ